MGHSRRRVRRPLEGPIFPIARRSTEPYVGQHACRADRCRVTREARRWPRMPYRCRLWSPRALPVAAAWDLRPRRRLPTARSSRPRTFSAAARSAPTVRRERRRMWHATAAPGPLSRGVAAVRRAPGTVGCTGWRRWAGGASMDEADSLDEVRPAASTSVIFGGGSFTSVRATWFNTGSACTFGSSARTRCLGAGDSSALSRSSTVSTGLATVSFGKASHGCSCNFVSAGAEPPAGTFSSGPSPNVTRIG